MVQKHLKTSCVPKSTNHKTINLCRLTTKAESLALNSTASAMSGMSGEVLEMLAVARELLARRVQFWSLLVGFGSCTTWPSPST